jgi:peptidoglycan/xylan/chitin deacetylase (PgdA/CDA1 family)
MIRRIVFALCVVVVTGLMFSVMCVEGAAHYGGTSECASSTSLKDNQRVLTVVMYHSVLKNRQGKYVVSPETFESDIKELLARGYTTVFPSEIVAFVERGGSFPEKPLLITFDDGHYNNAHYCQPILEKYNCKAVINIVGAFCDQTVKRGEASNVSYAYFTWDQLKELAESGVFEIGNHTYNMHNKSPRFGMRRIGGESDEDYRAALTKDVMRLQKRLADDCGVTPICFAYPFGAHDKFTKSVVVDMGFKMIFNCHERRMAITSGDPKCLHQVSRFNRESGVSSAEFFNRMERTGT